MTKRISKNQTGRFISIPFVVLKSESYRNLKPYAAKLLNLMLMQFNGGNNGDLSASWSTMSEYGFKSKGTLNRSIKALLEADLIRKTRESYFQHPNNQCALYCVTWKSIDECLAKRLNVKATKTPPRKFSMEKTIHPVPKRDTVRPQNGTGEKASDLKTVHSEKASDLKTGPESRSTVSQNSTPTNLPSDTTSTALKKQPLNMQNPERPQHENTTANG
jgi:hypothetical protein